MVGIMKKLLVIAVALSLGGCATVTRGTTNKITFESEPEGAYVETNIGQTCPETPCVLEFSRKAEFTATFSKQGYHDKSIAVQTRIAGAGVAGIAGNVLIGGIVGVGVDAASGATLEHYPNPVRAELVPARVKSRKGKKSGKSVPTS